MYEVANSSHPFLSRRCASALLRHPVGDLRTWYPRVRFPRDARNHMRRLRKRGDRQQPLVLRERNVSLMQYVRNGSAAELNDQAVGRKAGASPARRLLPAQLFAETLIC